ncbi:MAG TPA: hypothetical protein DCY20_04505 [Firmicutes bacterium]|nr:hypothetical protein [Bacillota bacterium]
MFLCHKMPQRSFFYKGKQFPICARCTGILVGYGIGILYICLIHKTHLVYELGLMIPIAIDGIGQYLGRWESTNTRRFVTGVLAGIATVCLFRFAAYSGLNAGREMNAWLKSR